MVKIGVFDSGIGGKSVANKLEVLFPEAQIIFANDPEHVPYGSRTPAEVTVLTKTAIQPLIDADCDAIVIACNTATTNSIGDLRAAYPDTHFVGIEPMVKPAAALTKSGTIAILATPRTLASPRYAQLKSEYTSGITVIEPDCSNWASLIERNHMNQQEIRKVAEQIQQADADVAVLGCTHYHWIKEDIQSILGPNVTILEPSDAIGARLDSLLSTDFEPLQ